MPKIENRSTIFLGIREVYHHHKAITTLVVATVLFLVGYAIFGNLEKIRLKAIDTPLGRGLTAAGIGSFSLILTLVVLHVLGKKTPESLAKLRAKLLAEGEALEKERKERQADLKKARQDVVTVLQGHNISDPEVVNKTKIRISLVEQVRAIVEKKEKNARQLKALDAIIQKEIKACGRELPSSSPEPSVLGSQRPLPLNIDSENDDVVGGAKAVVIDQAEESDGEVSIGQPIGKSEGQDESPRPPAPSFDAMLFLNFCNYRRAQGRQSPPYSECTEADKRAFYFYQQWCIAGAALQDYKEAFDRPITPISQEATPEEKAIHQNRVLMKQEGPKHILRLEQDLQEFQKQYKLFDERAAEERARLQMQDSPPPSPQRPTPTPASPKKHIITYLTLEERVYLDAILEANGHPRLPQPTNAPISPEEQDLIKAFRVYAEFARQHADYVKQVQKAREDGADEAHIAGIQRNVERLSDLSKEFNAIFICYGRYKSAQSQNPS